MNKQDLIEIRPFMEGDYNFISSTFLKSLYFGDTWFSLMPEGVFMFNYHKVVEQILKNRGNMISVACLKDAPTAIIGYSITSDDCVHYVYVKREWRKIGVAKDLVPPKLRTVTHLTKIGLSIMKAKRLIFNPFKI